MDFFEELDNEDFNKLEMLLCPVCYKTIPSLSLFIEPQTNSIFITIKCPNQENIAAIPLKDFLSQYLLYESIHNHLLFKEPSQLNKYNITESNSFKQEDMYSLKHFRNSIPIKNRNKCAVCSTKDNGNNISNFCAQCLQWFCPQCLPIHNKLANEHMLNWFGFEIKDKCMNDTMNDDNTHFEIKQCNKCNSIVCEQCEKGDCCPNCLEEELEEYHTFRKNLKENYQWDLVVDAFERKMKQDEEYKNNFIQVINELIDKYKQIQLEMETIFEQHKQINKEIFCLLKLLYANFEKAKSYMNFTILKNIKNNFSFNLTKFTPNQNTLNDITEYKQELINYYNQNKLIIMKYNNFLYKNNSIDITLHNANIQITSMFYLEKDQLLLCAIPKYLFVYSWDNKSNTLIKNNTLSKKTADITICEMTYANSKKQSVVFKTTDSLLGLITNVSESSLSLGLISPRINALKIQGSVFNFNEFFTYGRDEGITVLQLTESNKIKQIKQINKKITILCEISQEMIAYTDGHKLSIERVGGNKLFGRNEIKHIPQLERTKGNIMSILMLYEQNKLLIIRSNVLNNFNGTECIVINNVISQNNQHMSTVITKIPYQIESVIRVGEFIFGKIPLHKDSKERYYNILNIDIIENTKGIYYSNVNIQSNFMIDINNKYYLMQRDGNISIFKHTFSKKFTKETKCSPIALYNVVSNETI